MMEADPTNRTAEKPRETAAAKTDITLELPLLDFESMEQSTEKQTDGSVSAG